MKNNLLKQIRSLVESPENQRRLAVQAALNRKEGGFAFNSWHWGAGLSVGDSASPVPGMSIREMALRLGRLEDGFAQAVIERQLESQLRFFEHPASDTPVATQVFSNLGLSWLHAAQPTGEICQVLPSTGAFIHQPVLGESCAEWTKLPRPVFAVDEMLHDERMGLLHELTVGMFPLMDDLIPLPIGSVFGTASRLRGDADLLMDFRLCPGDVHALMRFLTDAARSFNLARAEFLARDPWSTAVEDRGDYLMYIFTSMACLGGMPMHIASEDHVSANMFSEDDYVEFIYPYQKELLGAFPRWYVHSCGNLTPFYKHISKLPNLHRVHVSPWSRLEAAVEALGNSVILEIHQPMAFDSRSPAEIDRLADHVLDVCGDDCTVDVVLPPSENGIRYKNRILARANRGG